MLEAFRDGSNLTVLFPMLEGIEDTRSLITNVTNDSALDTAVSNVTTRLIEDRKVPVHTIGSLTAKLESMPIEIMLETTEAVRNLQHFLRVNRISGFSVGTNDLARYAATESILVKIWTDLFKDKRYAQLKESMQKHLLTLAENPDDSDTRDKLRDEVKEWKKTIEDQDVKIYLMYNEGNFLVDILTLMTSKFKSEEEVKISRSVMSSEFIKNILIGRDVTDFKRFTSRLRGEMTNVMYDIIEAVVKDNRARMKVSMFIRKLSVCGEMGSWFRFYVFIAKKFKKLEIKQAELPFILSMASPSMPFSRMFLRRIKTADYESEGTFLEDGHDTLREPITVNNKANTVVRNVFNRIYASQEFREIQSALEEEIEKTMSALSVEELTSPKNEMRTFFTTRLLSREKEIPVLPHIFKESIPPSYQDTGMRHAFTKTIVGIIIAILIPTIAFAGESAFWTAWGGWAPALVVIIPIAIVFVAAGFYASNLFKEDGPEEGGFASAATLILVSLVGFFGSTLAALAQGQGAGYIDAGLGFKLFRGIIIVLGVSGIIALIGNWVQEEAELKAKFRRQQIAESPVGIVIGVTGTDAEGEIKELSRPGIKLFALNKNTERANINELERRRRENGAYATGVIDVNKIEKGLNLKEVVITLAGEIEKEDRLRVIREFTKGAGKFNLSKENTLEEVQKALDYLSERLPVTDMNMRTAELSVYNYKWNALSKLTGLHRLSQKTLTYIRNEENTPRGMLIRVDEPGELKMQAAAHNRRNNPRGLELKVILALKDVEEIKKLGSIEAKQKMLDLMDIDRKTLKAENVIVMTREAADGLSLSTMRSYLSAYADENIAIADKKRERSLSPEDKSLLENGKAVFVEYEGSEYDGLATGQIYDFTLSLMAHKSLEDLTLPGVIQDSNGLLWFSLPRIQMRDIKALREELEAYRNILIAA